MILLVLIILDHQSGPLSLSVGAIIENVVNSTENISNQVLIKSDSQTISFIFNKSVSNHPTLGINGGACYQFVYKSNSDKTLQYNFTNNSSRSYFIVFGAVFSNNSSYSTGLNVIFNPFPALTFSLISDVSQQDTVKTNYDVGTLYDLYSKLKDRTWNTEFSGFGISINGGGADIGDISQVYSNTSLYNFTLNLPTEATTTGNEKQLTVTNAKDVNNIH